LRSLHITIVAVDDDDDDGGYVMQLGSHPVAVVGSLVQQWESDNTKRETINTTIQTHNTQNRHKYKTKKNKHKKY